MNSKFQLIPNIEYINELFEDINEKEMNIYCDNNILGHTHDIFSDMTSVELIKCILHTFEVYDEYIDGFGSAKINHTQLFFIPDIFEFSYSIQSLTHIYDDEETKSIIPFYGIYDNKLFVGFFHNQVDNIFMHVISTIYINNDILFNFINTNIPYITIRFRPYQLYSSFLQDLSISSYFNSMDIELVLDGSFRIPVVIGSVLSIDDLTLIGNIISYSMNRSSIEKIANKVNLRVDKELNIHVDDKNKFFELVSSEFKYMFRNDYDGIDFPKVNDKKFDEIYSEGEFYEIEGDEDDFEDF